ncbi:MAG: tetratricopeptide repeat protein [Calditrichaeota bacterium]|nr:MAG: tetratricopeptide repeat protein [Calditrichota bacterium]
MKMDLTILLILIVLTALLAMGLLLAFRKRPIAQKEESLVDYIEGLNVLLRGDHQTALKKFREAVVKDSNNIDAYIKIGDLLREKGDIQKAIKTHQFLTVRRGLSQKQQIEILKSLAQDYQSAKDYDRALEIIEQILDLDKNNLWAHELKLKIFEQMEAWNNAFREYKNIMKLKGSVQNGRLALYKVYEGLKLSESGNEKEARARFKDAIKIAPEDPPGYIYLADSYIKENRKREALKVLKQFMEKVPSHSELAFERLKKMLFEEGAFGKIENIYLDILEEQPDNLPARFALAEIYEKKGDVTRAIELCTEILKREPSNKKARRHLVRLYHKAGKDHEAVEQALQLFTETSENQTVYRCKNCDYQSTELFWRCPECFEWETAII